MPNRQNTIDRIRRFGASTLNQIMQIAAQSNLLKIHVSPGWREQRELEAEWAFTGTTFFPRFLFSLHHAHRKFETARPAALWWVLYIEVEELRLTDNERASTQMRRGPNARALATQWKGFSAGESENCGRENFHWYISPSPWPSNRLS